MSVRVVSCPDSLNPDPSHYGMTMCIVEILEGNHLLIVCGCRAVSPMRTNELEF